MLYLTYLGGGHEMSRAVKHVIDPASDPKVAISIALSTVPRHVVTREPREIGFLEPFIWGKKVNSEKKYHRQSTCLGPHRQCAWCQARGGRTQCNLHLPLSPKKSNEYDSWFIISWLFLPLSPLHPICMLFQVSSLYPIPKTKNYLQFKSLPLRLARVWANGVDKMICLEKIPWIVTQFFFHVW